MSPELIFSKNTETENGFNAENINYIYYCQGKKTEKFRA
jgi:hypothetical protein